MNYEQIRYEVDTSATLKLLRTKNVAFTVSFLHQQFKVTQRISIGQLALEESLGNYIEFLQESYGEELRKAPREYLNDWCNSLWLRKTFDTSDEPVFSLTPESEKAIAWLEDLQQRDEFIGTESRFLQILSLLKEIKEGSTADVDTRIAQLEADRDRIQQEIDAIRDSGVVDPFSETQLRERFVSANRMTRQLIADFRAVEQNFRALTRNVQMAQLEQDSRRGAVVGRVLDADEALKDSDQGRSFYTFFRFLMSDSQQRELQEMITAVYTIEPLKVLGRSQRSLRRIIQDLLNSATYIVQSNHRLTEKLRQMLDERNRQENRRVAELIAEVKVLAKRAAEVSLEERDFWRLEGEPKISLVMERPLHPLEENAAPTLAEIDFTYSEAEALEEELDALAQQFYVDELALRRQIDRALEERNDIALPDLIALYPVTRGLPEVVTYLSIASRSQQHSISPNNVEKITIDSLEDDKTLTLSLPKVIFRR